MAIAAPGLLMPFATDSLLFRTDALYGVRFGGRNTSIVVNAEDRSQAISKARKKKRRGGTEAVEVWMLDEVQARQARAGRWVRTNSKGESRAKQGHRGQGPPPKAYHRDSLLVFRGDRVGKPCGNSFISAAYNCSEGKQQVATQRLRVSPRVRSRYSDRIRAERGLSAKRHNVTQEFDTAIKNIRKIKDPQERYNAAQELENELRQYPTSSYDRSAFATIRKKVRSLINSTRTSAARRENTRPRRERSPYLLPRRQQAEQVRSATGQYISIDSIG